MAVDHPHAGPLPCGTLIDDLIAQVTGDATPLDRAHQTACRYCQAALETIQQAWEEFQELARSAVAVPEDLAERIMVRIRSLGRASGEGLLITADRGETRVSPGVLAQAARAAARSVAHVAWASVLIADEDPEDAGSVLVSLRLVVDFGPAIDEVAEAVRLRVITALDGQAGATVSRVDVVVEDIVVGDETP